MSPDAVDNPHGFGLLAVGQEDFSACGALGVDQPLEFHGRDDIREATVAVGWNPAGVERLETGSDDDGAGFDFLDGVLHLMIYGVAITDFGADLALARFEMNAGLFVDKRNHGHGLAGGDPDGRRRTEVASHHG